uniref:Uncharacterized protein n=1 Tax=Lepeophtheirus salmonis TaxID=72036 RepID=A0A0K2UWD6_LEPSM
MTCANDKEKVDAIVMLKTRPMEDKAKMIHA